MRNRGKNKDLTKPSDKGINFAKPLEMKKKILVADDDPGLRDIFKIILKRAGYDVQIVEDAREIFDNNFKVPDVFLIDKLLSGIDGSDVCRYLKNNPLTSHVSVVMISALPDIATSSIRAGANDFIEKPFDVNYLLQVIERNIIKTKQAKRLERTAQD
jgi:DNA-binding NtrC family response regulator